MDKSVIKKRKIKENSEDSIYKVSTLLKEHKIEYTNYPNNVLFFDKERNTIHPTQKPIDLLEYLIKTYTRENDIVLDNCMGSGSTGVAAGNLNRRFIGIELDKNYFEKAKDRISRAYIKQI